MAATARLGHVFVMPIFAICLVIFPNICLVIFANICWLFLDPLPLGSTGGSNCYALLHLCDVDILFLSCVICQYLLNIDPLPEKLGSTGDRYCKAPPYLCDANICYFLRDIFQYLLNILRYWSASVKTWLHRWQLGCPPSAAFVLFKYSSIYCSTHLRNALLAKNISKNRVER